MAAPANMDLNPDDRD